jgi:AraC family transcriptional regulator
MSHLPGHLAFTDPMDQLAASPVKTPRQAPGMLRSMSRADSHGRTLALIEARLDEPLTLEEIAGASGLSAFHFSRLFTALHGESVMAYVRRRRLAKAARRLTDEAEASLAEMALDCGFESQQAFTRAFTRQYGVSPGRFRRPGRFPRLQPGDPVLSNPSNIDLERVGELNSRGAFRAAGMKSRFDRDSMHAIPALWDQLMPHLPVAGSKGGTMGLCLSAEPNLAGFDYMAGVELEDGAADPQGLETVEVPAQAYAVWRLIVNGDALHPQMQAALRDIWGRRLKDAGLKPSGGPDFELYPPYFNGSKAGQWVEFWIPVEA